MRSAAVTRMLVLQLAALCAFGGVALAAPEPAPYGTNDFGGFRNILPPGSNGLANATQLAAFVATGQTRPPHNDDQLAMYRDLIGSSPGLREGDLPRLFKDATFGVRPEELERRYSPRDDVTILRDSFGVPHVYGDTRAGAMFGIGYATAEDRLFFMDVLRNLGRAQLSSFAGGAPANRAFDRMQWHAAPYTEADLQRQIDQRVPERFEQFADEAEQLRADLREYVAGVNQYIVEARADPAKMPGEYAALGRSAGPEDWKGTDVVAAGSLIGAILGTGGGREVDAAVALQEARRRFGPRRGTEVWRDFRSAEDPEAPVTVRDGRFRYGASPRRPARNSVALPDPGSVEKVDTAEMARAGSNALLVSAGESESGRPLAVFGPQTGYFAPQVLMEQEIHAPGIEARGVGFPGTNLYVQIGHGRDYAWSATTSAQDLVDTFALELCDPTHYRYRGRCRAIEVLERRNSWEPNLADPTPAGTETLRAERTALGIVEARATIRGRPVIYVRKRSTYFHEVDSGLAFSLFNDPRRIRSARDFQRAAYLINHTFNWFYVDDRDIAVMSAGANPVRASGTDPSLPIRGLRRFEWRGLYTPIEEHPQTVNQDWIADWNNKQARGYRAADSNWGYGSTYRVKPLADRIRRGTRGRRRMSLVELVDAMADAATVDLRGDAVLPWALRVLGKRHDPELAGAIGKLAAWRRDGTHRIDRDGDGTYEHAEAIRIMDAWWPRWLRAQFQPVLGRRLFAAIEGINELVNLPNNHGDHLGSAWQDGWYGYAQKDLRALLGRRVRGRFSRVYCGRGRLSACRRALAGSLREALQAPPDEVYGADPVCAEAGREHDQDCHDDLWFRPLGGVTQPLIPWQNRPTFQQVVEVRGHRPRR